MKALHCTPVHHEPALEREHCWGAPAPVIGDGAPHHQCPLHVCKLVSVYADVFANSIFDDVTDLKAGSALHLTCNLATLLGHTKVAKVLLAHRGIDVNLVREDLGTTPLFHASEQGEPATVFFGFWRGKGLGVG